MRTPITYYGGKQKLLPEILPRIPSHLLYAEPFCGGAAVFFGKRPSEVEVLNDRNGELINFYLVLKTRFDELKREIELSLHSRRQHEHAWIIYLHPDLFDPVKRAWAVWMLSSLSYASKLDGSFGYDKTDNTTTKKHLNSIEEFGLQYEQRLRRVQLENTDALYIIRSRDHSQAFFYCDPPYFNSDMGHYRGYTREDFIGLLQTLAQVKGKFLLSSYPSKELEEFREHNGWKQVCFQQQVSVNNKSGKVKTKTEVLTGNYSLSVHSNQKDLFDQGNSWPEYM